MDGIILVNKPSGITSHDVVQKARRKLHISKIGHTGTLDPLANGLMLLTVGKATKILPYMAHYFKEYIAEMKLGIATDTLDITGTVIKQEPVKQFSQQQILEALNSFLGKTMQIPPMYSAKKVNGQKLYDLARQNIEIERQPVEIECKEIELLSYNQDIIKFRVLCSTGTYIRSLIEDIASKLNTVATMSSLQRTKIDQFNLNDAIEIEEINIDCNFVSAYQALSHYTFVEVNDPKEVYNGHKLKFETTDDMVMVVYKKDVLAAYQYNPSDGYYYSKRGLW